MDTPLVRQRAGVGELLRDRSLVYYGPRGTDAASLASFGWLSHAFSLTCPAVTESGLKSIALENIRGTRMDIDKYDVDCDDSAPNAEFRRRLSEALTPNSLLFSYVPQTFYELAALERRTRLQFLGWPRRLQRAFDYKPWVEREIESLGIATIAWEYFSSNDVAGVIQSLRTGTRVLRPAISSGGDGLTLIETAEDVERVLKGAPQVCVSSAPVLSGAIPLNVGGVVWRSGVVTLHPASVQLIGIPSCTDRRFGFCGNDFAQVRTCSNEVLARVEAVTTKIGKWLYTYSYRGAFGVDFLLCDGKLLFTELNPRLQGSSALSSRLTEEIQSPGIVLEHLASLLGGEPHCENSLRHSSENVREASQVYVHRSSSTMPSRQRRESGLHPVRELLPADGVVVDTGGVIARLEFERSVTADGLQLDAETEAAVLKTHELSDTPAESLAI